MERGGNKANKAKCVSAVPGKPSHRLLMSLPHVTSSTMSFLIHESSPHQFNTLQGTGVMNESFVYLSSHLICEEYLILLLFHSSTCFYMLIFHFNIFSTTFTHLSNIIHNYLLLVSDKLEYCYHYF